MKQTYNNMNGNYSLLLLNVKMLLHIIFYILDLFEFNYHLFKKKNCHDQTYLEFHKIFYF